MQRQEEAVLIPNWFDKPSMLQCQISQPASYYTTFFTQTNARTHTHTHNYLLVHRSQIPNRRSAKLFNPTPHNNNCFLSPLLFSQFIINVLQCCKLARNESLDKTDWTKSSVKLYAEGTRCEEIQLQFLAKFHTAHSLKICEDALS